MSFPLYILLSWSRGGNRTRGGHYSTGKKCSRGSRKGSGLEQLSDMISCKGLTKWVRKPGRLWNRRGKDIDLHKIMKGP